MNLRRFRSLFTTRRSKAFYLLIVSSIVIFLVWFHIIYHPSILPLQATYHETSVKLDAHLPCVAEFSQDILNDPLLPDSSKKELLGNISSLTYRNRNKWISTLNPVIIQESQELSKVRSVCPIGSIALVTITSGLSNNIQEWLFYHLLLGMQTIILFDDSVPGSLEQQSLHKAILIFVEHGYVIHRFVQEHVGKKFSDTQKLIYNQALQEYKDTYKWIGFIDHDEFVTLHQDKCLPSFLSKYTEFGGVVLQNRFRGWINVTVHDMTRTHFEQYEYTTAYSRVVKSFVQPEHTRRMAVHHAVYRIGWWAVNFQRHHVRKYTNCKVEGEPSEEFSVAEVRHFYMGDLQHALYEKVCGLNDERIYFRDIRTGMIKHGLTEGSAKKETDFLLPLIHDEFKTLFFQKIST